MLCDRLRVKPGVRGSAIYLLGFVILWLLAGCARDFPPTPTRPPDTPTPEIELQVVPGLTVAPTQQPYPWTDESSVMAGLCFESVYDAAGKTYVLRSAEALSGFFDLADNSALCRRPVTRAEFDFSGDRILAGTWTRAVGCAAQHTVQNVRRDDTARTLFIFLKLNVEGDCTYELVRPFWIGLTGISDYEVQFVVE
jgi:hypothetical protein